MADNHEVANKNREFFDSFAEKYDSEDWVKDLTVRFTQELRDSSSWIGVPWTKPGDTDRQVKMLDFACGPGMASNAFFDYVTITRGLDISSGMVDEYNKRTAEKGISKERMHAIRGNILQDPPEPEINTEELFNADFAAICWALHHMDDPGLVLKKLAERLKPGGVLLVLDWQPESKDGLTAKDGGHFAHHDHHHGHHHGSVEEQKTWEDDAVKTVAHHGFNESQMRQLMTDAGLMDVGHKLTDTPFRFGRGKNKGKELTAFLCRGVKT